MTGAQLSADRMYRYTLWREWDATKPAFVVIGLNPSTADETADDPTIRRCIGFAKREGCGKLVMLNLFAFRATKPCDCFAAVDPVGPLNDATIAEYANCVEPRIKFVVAAWGAGANPTRASRVTAMFGSLYCFGRTKIGQPKHPLYLAASTPLEPYRGRSSGEPT